MSLNRVVSGDRSGETLIQIPGAAPSSAADCPYKYFCTYEGYGYTGTIHRMYNCQWYYTPYVFHSWVNHQTPGTRAVFQYYYHQYYYTTPGAPSQNNSDPRGDYTFYIKPC